MSMQDTLAAIKNRKSIRSYIDKKVPQEILEDLIDCARLAPTGYNKQAWKFAVITDKEIKKEIAGEAKYGRFIKEAGACVAVFCDENEALTSLEDASAATENILIAAAAYGLGTCWVNSYKKEHSNEVENILNTPDNYTLMTLIAVGYYESEKENKERNKKSLDEVLVWNKF